MDIPGDLQIESPCVGICELNQQDVCTGCGRSLDEIGDWLEATAAEKTVVAERARRRLASLRGANQQSR